MHHLGPQKSIQGVEYKEEGGEYEPQQNYPSADQTIPSYQRGKYIPVIDWNDYKKGATITAAKEEIKISKTQAEYLPIRHYESATDKPTAAKEYKVIPEYKPLVYNKTTADYKTDYAEEHKTVDGTEYKKENKVTEIKLPSYPKTASKPAEYVTQPSYEKASYHDTKTSPIQQTGQKIGKVEYAPNYQHKSHFQAIQYNRRRPNYGSVNANPIQYPAQYTPVYQIPNTRPLMVLPSKQKITSLPHSDQRLKIKKKKQSRPPKRLNKSRSKNRPVNYPRF